MRYGSLSEGSFARRLCFLRLLCGGAGAAGRWHTKGLDLPVNVKAKPTSSRIGILVHTCSDHKPCQLPHADSDSGRLSLNIQPSLLRTYVQCVSR